jgi:hypothetical protein
MTLRSLFLPVLLCTALSAQEPVWLGTWKLASAPDIGKAIEACTAEMSFITRPIARSRLKKLNPAYQKVAIARSGNDFTIQFDERTPIRVPADGQAVAWTREDGEKFMVSLKLAATELLQHYQGVDGERSNRFRVDATGKLLSLDVTVKSQKLPAPLVYTLSYSR